MKNKVQNKAEKKRLENNGEYIVIHKETLVNYFFISVLLIALIIFLLLLFLSISRMFSSSNSGLNEDLISYFNDENLNITYPIPGGNWVLVNVEDTEAKETVEASWGSDNYFSIDDDTLTEEVLSLLTINESSDTGFREFMTFTFMPDVAYQNEEFVSFCEEVFKKNIENSGTYDSFDIYSSIVDEYSGVLLKAKITQTIENEDGTSIQEDTYYNQYIKRIGKNIGTITYGSLIEDDTVDKYLQYFFNNIYTEKGLIS